MKRVYFDTNIYNHIVDHPRSDAIKKFLINSYNFNELEILFSVNNYEEICCTEDIERRNALLRLADTICCNHKFTLSHGDLIRKEIERSEPVIDIYDKTDFKNRIQKTINTSFPEKCFEEIRERKRKFREFQKDTIQKLEYLWQDNKDTTFKDFYLNSLKNPEFKTLLGACRT